MVAGMASNYVIVDGEEYGMGHCGVTRYCEEYGMGHCHVTGYCDISLARDPCVTITL